MPRLQFEILDGGAVIDRDENPVFHSPGGIDHASPGFDRRPKRATVCATLCADYRTWLAILVLTLLAALGFIVHLHEAKIQQQVCDDCHANPHNQFVCLS